jgi:hypothetical protein
MRVILLFATVILWILTYSSLTQPIALVCLAMAVLLSAYSSLTAWDFGVLITRNQFSKFQLILDSAMDHSRGVGILVETGKHDGTVGLWARAAPLRNLLTYLVLYPAYRVLLAIASLSLSLWYLNYLHPSRFLSGAGSDTTAGQMSIFLCQNLVSQLTKNFLNPGWVDIAFQPSDEAQTVAWIYTALALGACASLIFALSKMSVTAVVMPPKT